jgi:glucosamine-6-phosphate deaminase
MSTSIPRTPMCPTAKSRRIEIAEYGAEYEQRIRDAGGIDYQILGIGRTGHIGFNEPGSGAKAALG